MKLENLTILARSTQDYCVTAAGDTRIYCDGRLMAEAVGMEPRKWEFKTPFGRTVDVPVRAREMWADVAKTSDRSVLSDSGMFGSFNDFGYVRRYVGNGGLIHIKEAFRRCFDDDAEFMGLTDKDSVTVWESGRMVGIVMPVRVDHPDNWPSVPWVEDAVVYHKCEEFLDA